MKQNEFMRSNLGLYFHIPFCLKKCNYCAFYSCTNLNLIDLFVSRLNEQVLNSSYCGELVDSIYFGGGTPNLLTTRQLWQILNTIYLKYRVSKNIEITLEFNPNMENCKFYLQSLKRLGFNRLSVGVQSTLDENLIFLGRLHKFANVFETIFTAASVGFKNISIDFLVGLPGQSKHKLKNELKTLLSFPLTHLSVYQLKIEKNTKFALLNSKIFPCSDAVAEMFECVVMYLTKNGFNYYEVSNFAKPGFECVHNLKYWMQKFYQGFGPSAHSYYKCKRYYYPSNLYAFLQGEIKKMNEAEIFTKEIEWLILRLRLTQQISFNELTQHGFFNTGFILKLKELSKNKLCELNENGFKLTLKGLLVQNSLIAYLLDF